MVPTTRRTSRDCVDIVSNTDGTIAVYVSRHWAEQIVSDHNDAPAQDHADELIARGPR